MKNKLGDEARLRHMLECMEEIESAIKNVPYDQFISNHVLRIAVVKWIEIIGEASIHISEELKKEYAHVDWQAIKGMRNIVVHEYFGIKYDLIWEVASEHIPVLKENILQIIKKSF
jgi:uncharacterized protein with HEPN domain